LPFVRQSDRSSSSSSAQQQNHDDADDVDDDDDDDDDDTALLAKPRTNAAMTAVISNDAMPIADTNRHVEQLPRSHRRARFELLAYLQSDRSAAQLPSAGGWCAIERPSTGLRTGIRMSVCPPATTPECTTCAARHARAHARTDRGDRHHL
jgi:hypothetical protein